MPDTRRKTRRRGTPPRALRAAGLLVVIAAGLVSVILLLPPRQEEAPDRAEVPAVPAVSAVSAVPEDVQGGADTAPPQRPGAVRETPREPGPARPSAGAPPERPERVGRLAVVIDDVGYSLETLEAFLESDLPFSLSVLPGLPHSAEAARRIQAAGKQLLLHLPMEAQGGADPGPVAVLTTMSDDAVREVLAESLAEIPAVGVNNHMGSAATADRRTMRVVLRDLEARGLFFLDSRTTADSVAEEVGEEVGSAVLRRDVFLDNDPSAEAVLAQLQQGLSLAQRRGQAVLIGHVQNPRIVPLLEAAVPELERSGLQLVFAGQLVGGGGQKP